MVRAWQFISKLHSDVSIRTNKLRFHCFYWTFDQLDLKIGHSDWLDLKMFESIVSPSSVI